MSKHKEERLRRFIERLEEVDSTIEYVSGFTNYKSPIICKCKKCNNTWDTSTPDVLVRKTNISKCPQCGQIEKTRNLTLTQEEYEKLVAKRNPNIKIIGIYTAARKPLKYLCLNCGMEQIVNRAEVLNRIENYCPNCNGKFRYDTEIFKKKISIISPDIEIIGKYISDSKKVTCRCKICDHVWNPTATHLKQGEGCPECNVTGTSFTEQVILWAFRKKYGNNAVLHRDKHTINQELDIYIPSINLAIEPGSWHWHKNAYENDILKHSKCIEKNIRCIVIYDQVNEIIEEKYPKNDFWFYKNDLGKNYNEIKKLVNRIFLEGIGSNIDFTEEEWLDVFRKAKEQNIKKHDIFIEKLKSKNKHYSNIIIKSIYSRNTDLLECECKTCGYGKNGEWKPMGQVLLRGSGCPSCAGNIQKNQKNFEEELQIISPNIKVLGTYNNIHTPISCLCTKCGCEWLDTPHQLLKGLNCPVCTKGRIINHDQFVLRMKLRRPDIEVLGRYKNAKERVACKCKVCGYGKNGEWKASPNDLYNKKVCPKCAYEKKQ